MTGLVLVEGPAGSGKSQEVARMLRAGEVDIQADLTAQWVALRAVERGPHGRYPVRPASDPTITTGLAAYLRAVAVREGLRSGLNVAVTSGTPNTAVKWSRVAEEAGAPFRVTTIDPGEAVVRERLANDDGSMDDECEMAISRWYRR